VCFRRLLEGQALVAERGPQLGEEACSHFLGFVGEASPRGRVRRCAPKRLLGHGIYFGNAPINVSPIHVAVILLSGNGSDIGKGSLTLP